MNVECKFNYLQMSSKNNIAWKAIDFMYINWIYINVY